MIPSTQQTLLHLIASETLPYLRDRVWPLRLDQMIYSSWRQAPPSGGTDLPSSSFSRSNDSGATGPTGFTLQDRSLNSTSGYDEAEILQLFRTISASPLLLKEWTTLPGPDHSDDEIPENLKPESPQYAAFIREQLKVLALERVRIFGAQKTRNFILSLRMDQAFRTQDPSALRKDLLASQRIQNPFEFSSVFASTLDLESDATPAVQAAWLELSVLFEICFRWILQSRHKDQSKAFKRFLEARLPEWKRHHTQLKLFSKQGKIQSPLHALKTFILLDLGRAVLELYAPEISLLWKSAEKNAEPLPLTFWREIRVAQVSSPQVASLWAQALTGTSSLGTSLRLLLRPWRHDHSQVKRIHAETTQYLAPPPARMVNALKEGSSS